MDTRISPNYPATKLDNPTHEDLVDVLEDRVRFWLFEPAKALAPHPIGQVAGFNLLMGYFSPEKKVRLRKEATNSRWKLPKG